CVEWERGVIEIHSSDEVAVRVEEPSLGGQHLDVDGLVLIHGLSVDDPRTWLLLVRFDSEAPRLLVFNLRTGLVSTISQLIEHLAQETEDEMRWRVRTRGRRFGEGGREFLPGRCAFEKRELS